MQQTSVCPCHCHTIWLFCYPSSPSVYAASYSTFPPLNGGHFALCPDIPAGLINLQGWLRNPCCPSDYGPLVLKPAAQVTSDSSAWGQGLTGSSAAKLEKSETFLRAARLCVRGGIIQCF